MEWSAVPLAVLGPLTVAGVIGAVRYGGRVLAEVRALAEGQRLLDRDLRGHMAREEADRARAEAAAERERVSAERDRSAMWDAITQLRDGVAGMKDEVGQVKAEVAVVKAQTEAIDKRIERIETIQRTRET